METFILLVLMAVAYLSGAGIVMGGGRLLGFPMLTGVMTLLVFGMPLAACWVAELCTGLWRHTPGSLGLGTLNVAHPMSLAGFLTAIAAVAMRCWIDPVDPSLPRESSTLTPWVALALISTVLAVALWRFWPEPRARLW